jgi:ABC-type bacteriocin/lantibiotic exporter with double-glycine peptidase domain
MGKTGKLIWLSMILGITGIMSGCAAVTELKHEEIIKHSDEGYGVDFKALKQRHTLDCGATCLVAVMKYWGIDVSLPEIEKFLGNPPKGGYSLNQLKEYAQKMGLVAVLTPGTLDDLYFFCSLGRPCIIVYEKEKGKNHSLVVLSVNYVNQEEQTLKVMDPAKGKIISISAKWLTGKWEILGSPILLVAKGTPDEGGEPMAK